jgi:hypothetical protein
MNNDTGSLIRAELDALSSDVRRAVRRCELDPVDELELLRMLQEVRRFVNVPVPEETVPF